MAFINKAKKSLSSILSVFTKAKAELEAWDELTAAEQADVEQRIKVIKKERQQAAESLANINKILGTDK